MERDDVLTSRMAGITHRFLVLSGKGGVGKSTVAANLATLCARRGLTTGLLDVDVHGPSIPGLMGLHDAELVSDGETITPVTDRNGVKVVSVGFMLDGKNDAVIWRGPMKYNVIRQFLRDVMWGECDVLVVDAPPGTGDEPLSVVQLVGAPATAIIVTTPQDVALNDVRRCIGFCRRVELPVAGVVETMGPMACPRCGEEIDLFPGPGGAALAEEAEVPFLGSIPFDPRVVAACTAGLPLAMAAPDAPATQACEQIVDELVTTYVKEKA